MDLTFLRKIVTMAENFKTVATIFHLTQEDLEDPKMGEYVLERIRQYEAGYIMRKELRAKVTQVRVETNPLPPIETPDKEE